MAESGKIREIDSADSSDESTEFSDANNILSVRNELQVSRPSMLRTVQEFGKNIFQSLVKHSEEHGTVVAPTFVFNQNIKEGDNIETSIAGSSGFTLDRSSNTYEKTSTTKQKAAKSNDAVENETKGEIPFHFEDSIRVDHNLYLLYNEKLAKYGEVYRGLQTHKGSRGFDTIAIKSIKLSDKNRKEVEIIRKLRSHPNVITVLQSGTYFFGPIEHLFIAMEYYKSKTLTDFVNDDPKPKTDEVKHKQIEQVIEAVDHIHVNAVLHRDLKPDNILVSDNGRTLKIIDFGLGKQLRKGHSGTKMSTLRIGTDGWRAPEIYFSGICSKQSDIFSSALVIHFIYTDGSHPFGEDPDSWNLNIKLYQGCDLSKLERDLEDLVGWMIRYQPQQRPNTEQIRKHKYFRGQLVCPHPKLSLIVPKTPKKEIVEVRRESVKMKQMQLENEQEKRKMMKEMEKLKKKMKEQDSVKFRQESERMRREHAIEKMQEEKRKMEIEIEKLKTEKKGSVVRSALEKEVVRVKQEFEERMKQMELKNELEKLKMMEEMEKLIKKTKKEEIVKVRQESERMRREHEEEMKRMQEEKRKMEIEIKKLKTGKKEFQSLSQTTSGLRITNQQPSDGTMTWMWLFESLPGYEGKGTLALVLATCVITYSFSAGCLGGISYEAQEFTEYLPWNNHGRICYNLLHHAFNAGLIFKIQKVGYRRGKIVWNDEFPHKTNKTGGPENNGYPDPNHLTKLRETLEAKGFKF